MAPVLSKERGDGAVAGTLKSSTSQHQWFAEEIEAKGGHCLVAWGKVARPRELGGPGISDQKGLGWALRMLGYGWKKLNRTGQRRIHRGGKVGHGPPSILYTLLCI
jgi:hypothetical protein